MKKDAKKELATRTKEELIKAVRDLRQEIGKLSLDLKMKKLENTNLVYRKKKDVARILTYITQKEETKTIVKS